MSNNLTKPEPQFDYSALDVETLEFVRQKETRFKARRAYMIIEDGQDLIEMKERLEYGQFEQWVNCFLGISKERAAECMRIAREFKGAPGALLENFHKKALIILSSPSTPESAVAEALERAESGEKLTVKETEEIIKAKKQIRDQKEKLDANEKRIGELQKDLSLLREQLPTEDVKKQVAALEEQKRPDEKANPREKRGF